MNIADSYIAPVQLSTEEIQASLLAAVRANEQRQAAQRAAEQRAAERRVEQALSARSELPTAATPPNVDALGARFANMGTEIGERFSALDNAIVRNPANASAASSSRVANGSPNITQDMKRRIMCDSFGRSS